MAAGAHASQKCAEKLEDPRKCYRHHKEVDGTSNEHDKRSRTVNVDNGNPDGTRVPEGGPLPVPAVQGNQQSDDAALMSKGKITVRKNSGNGEGQTENKEKARRVSKQLRAGVVQINGNAPDSGTPFGGYNQSGNGREGGTWGLQEYLEVKAISGWK